MITVATAEEYISRTMRRLCSAAADDGSDAPSGAAAAHLFDIRAKFRDVASILGTAHSTSIRRDVDLPLSQRDSVEHRFRLNRWPQYDFVVCESVDGYAWGHRFSRAADSVAMPVNTPSDLRPWSHTFSEITAALGPPHDIEGWVPWESATFQFPEGLMRLCFVFDLLQTISPTSPPEHLQSTDAPKWF